MAGAQADRASYAKWGDVVGFLIHSAIGALNGVRAMFPVIIHRSPGADEQFVVALEIDLRSNVILIWIDVSLVTAQLDAIKPSIGVVIRRAELKQHTFSI